MPFSRKEAFLQITAQSDRAAMLQEMGIPAEQTGIVDENMVSSVFHHQTERVVCAALCLLFQCIGVYLIMTGDAPLQKVLRTCKRGRGVLLCRKCLTAVVYSLILYLTVYGCYLAKKWMLWKPDGLQLMIQNAEAYEWAQTRITFVQAMTADVCCLLTGMLTVTAVLTALFIRIRKKGLGFGVGFSLTVLPMLLQLFQPEISRMTLNHCFLYLRDLSSARPESEAVYLLVCLGIAAGSMVIAGRAYCQDAGGTVRGVIRRRLRSGGRFPAGRKERDNGT